MVNWIQPSHVVTEACLYLFLVSCLFHSSSIFPLTSAQDNFCGSQSPTEELLQYAIESGSKEVIDPLPVEPSKNGTSAEWIFTPKRKTDFLTLKFDIFDLGGPECDTHLNRYTSVDIETQFNGQKYPYRFCKGREPYTTFSSAEQLRIFYCNRRTDGRLQFTVSTGCTTNMLVTDKKESLSIRKKSGTPCWAFLRSLTNQGIHVKISNLETKKVASSRCQGAFFSMKETTEDGVLGRTILPDRQQKLCATDLKALDTTDFEVSTSLTAVNITYRNAKFTVTFWEPSGKKQPTEIPKFTISEQVKKEEQNVTTLAADPGFQEDQEGYNITHIIALASGAVLVVIAVMVTICIVKRRTPGRPRREPKKSKVEGDPSTKYSQAVTRDFDNSSVGSITNAMYGQYLAGNTQENDGQRRSDTERIPEPVASHASTRMNESRRKRLAELEDKYGPFPDIADDAAPPLIPPETHENALESESESTESQPLMKPTSSSTNERAPQAIPNSYELTRKGTRPLLPPPPAIAAASTRGSEKCSRQKMPIPCNIYETINNIQPDQDEKPSYDAVARDAAAGCMNGHQAKVSYDAVPAEDTSHGVTDDLQVSYDPVCEGTNSLKIMKAPTIDIHPAEYSRPMATASSTPLLNEETQHTPSQNHLDHTMFHAKSHDALGSKSNQSRMAGHLSNNYLHPRPSLPELLTRGEYVTIDSDRSCSLASSIQEDADNYLQPRPSNPDAFVACAYSSSEEISEMRRRLIKAAHPSLIDDPKELRVRNESPQGVLRKNLYDSPRPSLGDIRPNLPPVGRYGNPRSSEA